MSRAATPELRAASGSHPDAKRYKQAVDRVLGTFQAIESWPDNISFLTKLLRVLQSYPTISEIPSKDAVANSLALCLVPPLPNGVHQKALEIYAHIFALAGADSLANDLYVWLPGLLPVLSFASVSLKSTLIILFSTFIVPLRHTLRPVTRDIILSILPGLEDEHDEAFSAVLRLMEELRLAVEDDTLWWTSVWLACILASSNQRGGALYYLLNMMPEAMSDPVVCIGPDPGILVRAFSAGLTDVDALNQRGFLELLVAHLPLSATWLDRIPGKQLQLLMSAASQIVLRKDLSLNKRLWAWLLGPADEDGDRGADQLKHSGPHLLEALKRDMQITPARTCRVMLSLIDKQELAALLLQDMLESLLDACFRAEQEGTLVELRNSARALFDAIPSSVIFQYLWLLVTTKQLGLLSFTLQTFDFKEEDMLAQHLPRLMLGLLKTGSEPELRLACDVSTKLTTSALGCCTESTSSNPSSNSDANFANDWASQCFSQLEATQDAKVMHLLYELLLNLSDLTSISSTLLLTLCNKIAASSMLHIEHVGGITHLLVASKTPVNISLAQQLVAHLLACILDPLVELTGVSLLGLLSTVVPTGELQHVVASHVASDLASTASLRLFASLWAFLPEALAQSILPDSILLVIDALAFGSLSVQGTVKRWMRGTTTTAMLDVLLQRLEQFAPTRSDTVSILNNDIFVWQMSTDIPSFTYHLKLLASLAQVVRLDDGIEDLCKNTAMSALACQGTDAELLVSIAAPALVILGKCSGSKDETERFLVDRLIIAVHDGHEALQQVLLESMSAHHTDLQQLQTHWIQYGLKEAARRPVLRDWVDYVLKLRPAPNSIVLCLCDLVYQSLADMDSMLMSQSTSGLAMQGNISLLLNTLGRLRISEEDHAERISTDRPAGFLTNLLSATSAEEGQMNIPSAPSKQIIHLAVHVWAWASSETTNATSHHSITVLQQQAYDVLDNLFKRNPAGVVLELVNLHGEGKSAAKDLCIQLNASASDHLLVMLSKMLRAQVPEGVVQFLLQVIETKSADVVAQAESELIALLRHLASAGPTSVEHDVVLLCCEISSKLAGVGKKTRKDVNDSTMKVLTHALTKPSPELYDLLASLIPRLPSVFLDLDKVSGAVGAIMTQLIQPQLKVKQPTAATLSLLEPISQLDGVQKVWRRDVQDYFADSSFFTTSWGQGRRWSGVLHPWFTLDKDKVNEYLQKPNPSAPAHLFASQESERIFKIAQNQRLVFVVMTLPVDALLAKISLLHERLEELSSKFLSESLLLMQTLVLRISSEHLRSTWPLMVNILKRAFEQLLNNAEETLLRSACEALDVLLASRREDFQMYAHLLPKSQLTIDMNGSLYATHMKPSLAQRQRRLRWWNG